MAAPTIEATKTTLIPEGTGGPVVVNLPQVVDGVANDDIVVVAMGHDRTGDAVLAPAAPAYASGGWVLAGQTFWQTTGQAEMFYCVVTDAASIPATDTFDIDGNRPAVIASVAVRGADSALIQTWTNASNSIPSWAEATDLNSGVGLVSPDNLLISITGNDGNNIAGPPAPPIIPGDWTEIYSDYADWTVDAWATIGYREFLSTGTVPKQDLFASGNSADCVITIALPAGGGGGPTIEDFDAALVGIGTVTADFSLGITFGAIPLTGIGNLAANFNVVAEVEAGLVGIGVVVADFDIPGAVDLQSFLVGVGTVTADFGIVAPADLAASLVGIGTIAADVEVTVDLNSGLVGNGVITADFVVPTEIDLAASLLGVGVIGANIQSIGQAAILNRPKAQGYGVKLDDDWYRLAPGPETPLRFYNADSLAPRSADNSSSYENTLDLGYRFARADWRGGAGLDWYPRIIDLDQAALDETRFWDSANLDVSQPSQGEPLSLRLTRPLIIWEDSLPTAVLDAGNSREYFYLAEGSNVAWFDSWDLPATPAGTFDLSTLPGWTAGVEVITQIAVGLGDDVMVITNQGNLYLKPNGSSVFVAAYDVATDGDPVRSIWWAKGRWVGDRQDIAEVSSAELCEFLVTLTGPPAAPVVGTTVQVIDTFYGTLNHLLDAGVAIVGAFSDGSLRSYVPIQTDPSSVASVELQIRGQTPVPPGEEPVLLGYNQGVLLFTTIAEETGLGTKTLRVYQSQVLDSRFDFIVGDIQYREQWRGTSEAPDLTKNMATTRSAIYFTVYEGDGREWFWRYDLETTGLTRHLDAGPEDLRGFIIFDEQFGAVTANGDVLYLDLGHYQPTGYLITPNINFGLNTDINWTATMLQAENIQAGQGIQVQLFLSDEPEAITDPNHGTWVLVTQLSAPGQEGLENALNDFTSKSVAMMIKLFASRGGTQTPGVTRMAIRGLPKHRDWVIELPVNISDYVGVPHRRPVRVPYSGDKLHASLMDLQGQHVQAEIVDPPFLFRGIVDNLMNPVTYISDRGGVTKVCTLVLRGNRITGSQAATGDAGLGLGLLGVATLGIGQTGVQ